MGEQVEVTMAYKPDLVDECNQMLKRLCELAPELPPQARALIENFEPQARQSFGGQWRYVRHNVSADTKAARLASALREQRPLDECFVKAGVGRSTGYKLMGRK